jgi:hypothetical protein
MKGAVCTTFGGATGTPTLILRIGPLQLCADAGAAMAAAMMNAMAPIMELVRSVGMGDSPCFLSAAEY